ncbi:MAG: response regulator [Planctomycetota bacterium]|jgi:two-component system catabolic regulation response regulator CreB|nr:response regulator [Planctomycetota bacterium]
MARVLIVDDEPAIAQAVLAALAREGISAHHVETLAAARAVLSEADDVAMLILDVGLPDGSGLDLLRELQATGGPPILLLSARGDELDRVLGLELGADDYVVKPFSPRELTARVRVILRRSRSIPAVAPAETGLRHDEQAQRILLHGQALDLSRLEYRLLAVLMAQAGCVCSRSLLLDRAWDDPTSTVDRGVDTLVKSLRAKLRAVDDTCDPIRTVRGIGYCLELP